MRLEKAFGPIVYVITQLQQRTAIHNRLNYMTATLFMDIHYGQ